MQAGRNDASNRAADAAMAAAILVLGGLLAFSGLVILDHWRTTSIRRQSLQLEEVLGGASAATGALIVIWWLTSALLAVASALLHSSGHGRAAAAVGKGSPAFMRRLSLAALGLHLAAGPAAAHAGVPPSPPVGIRAEWAPAAQQKTNAESWLSPYQAASPGSLKEPNPVQPQWKPTAPTSNPGLLAPPPLRTEVPSATATEVTVLTGDSLWGIAARALGPGASDVDVALEWPRWYAANKAAIGDNPHVLLPGQILQNPSAT